MPLTKVVPPCWLDVRPWESPLEAHLRSGHIEAQQIDPAELSPGEFVQMVRRQVESRKTRIIVIDSLNGYLNSMPEERFLAIQLHELLTYLGQHGVLSIMVVAQHGLIGAMQSPVDVSYLSDSVLLLRYFETGGQVRQAISVVKKRTGQHERAIRELRMSSADGIRIGEPLTEFHGVLSGIPTYVGTQGRMMRDSSNAA